MYSQSFEQKDYEGCFTTRVEVQNFDIGKDMLRLHPPSEVGIVDLSVRCLPGRLCIKRKEEQVSEGGIYLPGSGSMDSDCGEVVSAGDGVTVKPGDWVAMRPNYGYWLEGDGIGLRFYGVEDDWELGLVATWVNDDWVPSRRWRRGKLEKKSLGILELPENMRTETVTILGDDRGYIVRARDAYDDILKGSDGYCYFNDLLIEAEIELCK